MKRPPEYSPLLRFACTLLRGYLLLLLGFAIVCLLLTGLGLFQVVGWLLLFGGRLLLRLTILITCYLAVAVLSELFRH